MKWFGSVSEWKQVVSVVNTNDEITGRTVTSIQPPIGVRFNDAVHAKLEQSSRFRLPQSPEQFKKLVLEFRSQENLINATLTKIVAEVVIQGSGEGGGSDATGLIQLIKAKLAKDLADNTNN